jgi:hypothetical protein
MADHSRDPGSFSGGKQQIRDESAAESDTSAKQITRPSSTE